MSTSPGAYACSSVATAAESSSVDTAGSSGG
jgi:hypothetical protein